ncbi:GmrSD restriction endonuclease domain-containing protein [Moorena producens]|uniref:GmrSD restriction endonuclease domain-containing protein n=1 Tax=Moorena producens TaxID=1155739 RepID=UPI003C75C5D0
MAELETKPRAILYVYKWYSENKLFVNRRYQRKLVWTLKEKQKLIESILKNYPIPAILIAELDDSRETYEIIDGLQRLHSIISFIETAFCTENKKYFDIQHFPTAKSRADEGSFVPNPKAKSYLSEKEVNTILEYPLAFSVMSKAKKTEVNDVFKRINTYGRRLSDQERRQAGVQNDFSNMVRELASTLRGDKTDAEILTLQQMPSISIDLPKTKHGYTVKAEDVFWVKQGILNSTDLRDSMDEECIADIAACIVGGKMIERSKNALDKIYEEGSSESERILAALKVYGSKKFTDEFKYCVDQIIIICDKEKSEKLRDIVFENNKNNAFSSVFAILMIALHELIFEESKEITNYSGIREKIDNIATRIETTRKATKAKERRNNVDQVKGLIGRYFIKKENKTQIYDDPSIIEIKSMLTRSEIELPNYELKQGLLSLSHQRTVDNKLIDKVIKTICAIANNGPDKTGKIIIGVTDKKADADRIKKLDNIDCIESGNRFVVGVNREAKILGISKEDYFSKWKNAIKNVTSQ